jgi:hypothetical protein
LGIVLQLCGDPSVLHLNLLLLFSVCRANCVRTLVWRNRWWYHPSKKPWGEQNKKCWSDTLTDRFHSSCMHPCAQHVKMLLGSTVVDFTPLRRLCPFSPPPKKERKHIPFQWDYITPSSPIINGNLSLGVPITKGGRGCMCVYHTWIDRWLS